MRIDPRDLGMIQNIRSIRAIRVQAIEVRLYMGLDGTLRLAILMTMFFLVIRDYIHLRPYFFAISNLWGLKFNVYANKL